jgi:GNAT superfamily N-acetyltransferase
MHRVLPAIESDMADVERIFSESISLAPWIPEHTRTPRDFAAESEGERIFVCRDPEDCITGFISIWEPAAFIHHLYVDALYKRRGVGTALLGSLDDWLPKPWRLKCVETNTSAYAFYCARGWHLIDRGHGVHGSYLLLEYTGDR